MSEVKRYYMSKQEDYPVYGFCENQKDAFPSGEAVDLPAELIERYNASREAYGEMHYQIEQELVKRGYAL